MNITDFLHPPGDNRRGDDGTPLIIHNIGHEPQEENILNQYPRITPLPLPTMTKRLLTITALLLLVPIAFWLTGWHWQGNEVPLARLLWLITQTAGSPVAFASIIALTALLCYSHRRGETRALLLVVLISLGATQISKSLLKPLIGEARPYVAVLSKHDPARIRAFYSVPRSARADAVRNYYARAEHQTPPYLIAHRAKDTGYSFPSGHTTFAASWALLFAGIIGYANRRRLIISGAVTAWAMLVMASRVWLGMHYPVDLAGGVILACAIHLPLLRAWEQRHTSLRLRRLLTRLQTWHTPNSQPR